MDEPDVVIEATIAALDASRRMITHFGAKSPKVEALLREATVLQLKAAALRATFEKF